MISITIDTMIEDKIENIILPLSSAILALLLVLQSYLLAFRKRLQISVILLFGLLFCLSLFAGFINDEYTLSYVAVYVLLCLQTNRYKVIFSAAISITFPLLI